MQHKKHQKHSLIRVCACVEAERVCGGWTGWAESMAWVQEKKKTAQNSSECRWPEHAPRGRGCMRDTGTAAFSAGLFTATLLWRTPASKRSCVCAGRIRLHGEADKLHLSVWTESSGNQRCAEYACAWLAGVGSVRRGSVVSAVLQHRHTQQSDKHTKEEMR